LTPPPKKRKEKKGVQCWCLGKTQSRQASCGVHGATDLLVSPLLI
jgi:hypothetical protein